MSKTQRPERRHFLKLTGGGLIATCLAFFVRSERVLAQDNLPLVKADDPQAKALGYIADAKKVDVKKWPKRAGADGAKQFCYNCQFYQTKEKDPKATKSAPCTLFPGKQVAAQGWCNSWTQNPNVKS